MVELELEGLLLLDRLLFGRAAEPGGDFGGGLVQNQLVVIRQLGRRKRRGQSNAFEQVRRLVARLDGRTGRRLVDPLVTGRAAIETGHVSEIVVPGELWQPDVVDLEWTAKGVEDRRFEQ